MKLSLFSFIVAVVWNNVFIVILYIGRKKVIFNKSFGVASVAALYGFSVFRMLFPLEFPFTAVVDSHGVYSNIVDALYYTIGSEPGGLNVLKGLCAVWFLGSLIFLFSTARRYIHAVIKYRRMKPAEDKQMKAVSKNVQKAYGRPMEAVIIRDKAFPGPMSFGLIRKYILLPTYPMNDQELYYVLAHEYIHLKSRDQWVKLLSTLYCNIFWWNPFSYLLEKDLAQSLEIMCDQRTTKGWPAEDKGNYMNMIIRDVKQKNGYEWIGDALSLAGTEDKALIKERFHWIMNPPPEKANKAMWAVVLLVFVFSYSFVIQSAYDPPIEEIETEAGAYEILDEDVYIRRNENGEYEFVSPYGSVVISDEKAEEYIKNGFTYEGEEY